MVRKICLLAAAGILATPGLAKDEIQIRLFSTDRQFSPGSASGRLLKAEEPPEAALAIRQEVQAILKEFLPYWNFTLSGGDDSVDIMLDTARRPISTIPLQLKLSTSSVPWEHKLFGPDVVAELPSCDVRKDPTCRKWRDLVGGALRALLKEKQNRDAILRALRDIPVAREAQLLPPKAAKPELAVFPAPGYPQPDLLKSDAFELCCPDDDKVIASGKAGRNSPTGVEVSLVWGQKRPSSSRNDLTVTSVRFVERRETAVATPVLDNPFLRAKK